MHFEHTTLPSCAVNNVVPVQVHVLQFGQFLAIVKIIDRKIYLIIFLHNYI